MSINMKLKRNEKFTREKMKFKCNLIFFSSTRQARVGSTYFFLFYYSIHLPGFEVEMILGRLCLISGAAKSPSSSNPLFIKHKNKNSC